ncbi:MAG: adenine deaminase [Mesoaciditoga sp.]|uniref:adenine deaminase n=1 Tax=Athalassotoga sp. TaxID=2022597 RepID=UPI000CBA514A|nr:MAG: adenine deaminase [Mesoaciditoga sp.]PMP80042.1 MAG: adenine deaminase [Mesoaciditoga sp.]HEU24830.1 adenine deaminase [Mesoaciditoga lauensis]
MKIENIIPVSLGSVPADLLLKNCKIVNVFTGKIEEGNIALFRKRIAGIGDYTQAKEVIDLDGNYVVPGLIDAHVHIESSMVDPVEFARSILPRGTTTIIADPHEIANVLGTEGIEYMLQYTEGIPLNIYMMIPSCVPATNMETNGATIDATDTIGLITKYPRVLGLGEVMNYPAVINADRDLMTKIEITRHLYKKIDGHAPNLAGKSLNAYISAFIRSDHECSTEKEALEKISRGMQVLIREGSVAKNLDDLIGAVTPYNERFFSFCTDDRHPDDIERDGHIDNMVRRSIEKGVDPIIAIRMATINSAQFYGLRSMGAIAPSYKADMVVTESLEKFFPKIVIKDSKIVARNGKLQTEIMGNKVQRKMEGNFRVPFIEPEDLRILSDGKRTRAIRVFNDSIYTEEEIFDIPPSKVPDLKNDLIKISVVSRYSTKKSIFSAAVTGFGLKKGSIATSVGHDSHNISVIGTNDTDMVVAVNEILRIKGGIVIAKDGKIVSELPLSIGGLMSELPMEKVVEKIKELKCIARDFGCIINDPFMVLSFVQLAVIPKIRITNLGLVDVTKGAFVDVV